MFTRCSVFRTAGAARKAGWRHGQWYYQGVIMTGNWWRVCKEPRRSLTFRAAVVCPALTDRLADCLPHEMLAYSFLQWATKSRTKSDSGFIWHSPMGMHSVDKVSFSRLGWDVRLQLYLMGVKLWTKSDPDFALHSVTSTHFAVGVSYSKVGWAWKLLIRSVLVLSLWGKPVVNKLKFCLACSRLNVESVDNVQIQHPRMIGWA